MIRLSKRGFVISIAIYLTSNLPKKTYTRPNMQSTAHNPAKTALYSTESISSQLTSVILLSAIVATERIFKAAINTSKF